MPFRPERTGHGVHLARHEHEVTRDAARLMTEVLEVHGHPDPRGRKQLDTSLGDCLGSRDPDREHARIRASAGAPQDALDHRGGRTTGSRSPGWASSSL